MKAGFIWFDQTSAQGLRSISVAHGLALYNSVTGPRFRQARVESAWSVLIMRLFGWKQPSIGFGCSSMNMCNIHQVE
jgi:hypothetical protein